MGTKTFDLAQLQESVQKINRAVEDFQPYSKKFIGEIMDSIEQNSSDFMDELEKVLRALKDNKAKKTWEAVLRYSEDVEAVYESWEGIDTAIAEKIQEEKPK